MRDDESEQLIDATYFFAPLGDCCQVGAFRRRLFFMHYFVGNRSFESQQTINLAFGELNIWEIILNRLSISVRRPHSMMTQLKEVVIKSQEIVVLSR